MDKFRYFIFTGSDETNKRQCFPVYKDDITLDLEQENNQQFYRNKLSGKIDFIKGDFDFILSQPFQTKYTFILERSTDLCNTWVEQYRGKFYRTDCNINYDNKRCVVQPDPIDEYSDVMAGLDKEYNLIPLKPVIESMFVKKRPLIQVYIPGQTVVSCFLSGNAWEQDANDTTDRNLIVNKYKFALANMLKEIRLTNSGNQVCAGTYTGKMTWEIDPAGTIYKGTLTAEDNLAYKIVVWVTFPSNSIWAGAASATVVRLFDNVEVYKFGKFLDEGDFWENQDFTLEPANGATGQAFASMSTWSIYVRYLLDVDTINGLNTYPLGNDDIVAYNRNYRRAIGYAVDVSYLSTNKSVEPTEWGRADDMKYYLPPYSMTGERFYPISRSTWGKVSSLWFQFNILDPIYEVAGRKTYVLKDAFPLYSVIDTFLKQFAPGIDHKPTPEYSQFLYGSQNPVNNTKFRLYVTQKSNMMLGLYQQPAQKALGTLQQFTNMLRDCFRCFWHIDDGKFIIEHISYYRNGGSYDPDPVIGTDLTTLINIRNSKSWAFNTNEISYDKVEMPDRFQFEWMDDVTEVFKGMPIEVISEYVTPGKNEDVSVSYFNSDVDMLMLAPEDASKDGFALLAAVDASALVLNDPIYDGHTSSGNNGLTTPKFELKAGVTNRSCIITATGYSSGLGNFAPVFYNGDTVIFTGDAETADGSLKTFNVNIPIDATHVGFTVLDNVSITLYGVRIPSLNELPFVHINMNGSDHDVQNGLLAFARLQPDFYVYDLPAKEVKINGNVFFASGVERKKKQSLNFPSQNIPDPLHLIKTNIGNGQIDKLSLNLHSRNAKTTLKYDTE
jgi:hypothetical protein